MSVFICWSGDRSHDLANALQELLCQTFTNLPKNDVFVSDQIEKGVGWFDSLVERLERSEVGIVCLTGENLDGPWLHFEAGALAMRLAKKPADKEPQDEAAGDEAGTARHRLFTLLHKVTGAELKGPLGAYQATSTTSSDMAKMFRAIARVLAERHLQEVAKSDFTIHAKAWEAFEKKMNAIAVPARKLIPNFESIFQRKTFNEPVHRCADQAWMGRYDGARLTRELLAAQLERVRVACSPHERGLFEMLLTELDGYAMAIQALLLTPKRFQLVDRGELEMDPGIRSCCEGRRLAIRSLAGLLLRSPDEPLQEEAVRFMGAETDEERKMIVHRLEGRIRPAREDSYERAATEAESIVVWQAIQKLTGGRKPIEYRESFWDLDRIYYYLLNHYFGTAALRWEPSPAGDGKGVPGREAVAQQHDWLCAARDVEMEVERYRARAKGGSLMPLKYALAVLQSMDAKNAPDPAEAHTAVNSALEFVQGELGELLKSDEGRPIAQVLRQELPANALGKWAAAAAAD